MKEKVFDIVPSDNYIKYQNQSAIHGSSQERIFLRAFRADKYRTHCASKCVWQFHPILPGFALRWRGGAESLLARTSWRCLIFSQRHFANAGTFPMVFWAGGLEYLII